MSPLLVQRIRHTPTRVIACGAVVAWVVSGAYMLHYGPQWHLDLRVYRDAGHALFHGGSPFTANFTVHQLPFTYTPFALLVLSPLAFGSLGLVETVWWLLSAVCLVGAVYLVITASFPSLPARRALAVAGLLAGVATLALEPVRSNMDYAQINLILMVMIVADMTRVRAPWRGVLIGLASAIKLTPLVFLFSFVVTRDWRSLARGVGVVVGVTAISWAVLPSDSARYWFHQVTDAGRTGQLGNVSNQSWNGLVHRPPFDGGHLGTAVWFVLALATLAAGVLLTRWVMEGGRIAEAVVVLALTELLVSPVSWTHHWSWLTLAPIAAVTLWRVHRVVAILLLVLVGLAVIAPYWWLQHGPLSYLAGNALVLAGAAVLVVWLVAEARSRRTADSFGIGGRGTLPAPESLAG
ncbi:MAG TPA: glycosyltransferase 87 family protein [Acidimicrobiales bacterium]|nr:glycosyltransferase 87 family protein [Acidimicrobiales bacterium]